MGADSPSRSRSRLRRDRTGLCSDDACESTVDSRDLSRSLTRDGDGAVSEGDDTRIPPTLEGSRSEPELCFDVQGVSPRAWVLEILYAEPHVERTLPKDATRAVLHRGRL